MDNDIKVVVQKTTEVLDDAFRQMQQTRFSTALFIVKTLEGLATESIKKVGPDLAEQCDRAVAAAMGREMISFIERTRESLDEPRRTLELCVHHTSLDIDEFFKVLYLVLPALPTVCQLSGSQSRLAGKCYMVFAAAMVRRDIL